MSQKMTFEADFKSFEDENQESIAYLEVIDTMIGISTVVYTMKDGEIISIDFFTD